MNYQREIKDRNELIKEHRAKIATLEAELDQLWRDEGIANADREVLCDKWGNTQPLSCRKCRKQPILVTKNQRQIDAIVDGQLVKVWQDYYVYAPTNGKLWCEKCQNAYNAQQRAWEREREYASKYGYGGGC